MFERPWLRGKFSMAAGLRPLKDRPIFLSTEDLDIYRRNKVDGRRDCRARYYPPHTGVNQDEILLVSSCLKRRLMEDLGLQQGETFNADSVDPLDTILALVAEDFALWKCTPDREWMALIHLFAPNHWSAEEKIGKSFREVHAPVPEIERVSANARSFFKQVQEGGPLERYAWGLATDTVLNRHPKNAEQARTFDTHDPLLWIRRERQVLFPISQELVGFTIHTSFLNLLNLSAQDKVGVRDSLLSMGDEVLAYKGLKSHRADIVDWIDRQL